MFRSARWLALNRYYRITKFYSFLKNTAIKGGVTLMSFIAILLLLEYFFLDINAILNSLVDNYSPKVVFLIFFISETILGLLPPEMFIAWSAKAVSPWTYLFMLATLSYVGGAIAYIIGKQLFFIPAIKIYTEEKIAQHIVNLRKWGGFLVLVGALLPVPLSIVSLACGLIKYNFKNYLLWALFRYLRFIIYALVIFRVF